MTADTIPATVAPMTPDQMRAWRDALNLSRREAGELLGLSPSTIEQYEMGRRKGAPEQPVVIPRHVALACAAIWHRLEPWGQ